MARIGKKEKAEQAVERQGVLARNPAIGRLFTDILLVGFCFLFIQQRVLAREGVLLHFLSFGGLVVAFRFLIEIWRDTRLTDVEHDRLIILRIELLEEKRGRLGYEHATEQLQADLKEEQGGRIGYEAATESLQSQVKELIAKLASLQAQSEKSANEASEEVARLVRQVEFDQYLIAQAELKSQVVADELGDRNQALEDKLAARDQLCQDLEERVEALTEESRLLAEELGHAQVMASQMDYDLGRCNRKLQVEIGLLKLRNVDVQHQLDEAIGLTTLRTQECADLTRSLQVSEARVIELVAKVQVSELQIPAQAEMLHKALAELKASVELVASLRKELLTVKRERETLKGSLQRARSETSRMTQSQLLASETTSQERIRTLTAENLVLQQRLAEASLPEPNKALLDGRISELEQAIVDIAKEAQALLTNTVSNVTIAKAKRLTNAEELLQAFITELKELVE